ncbi:DoxX family protein [Hymenobacter sp. BRD128]|uniref:DoxX family protein n=1 Tax=Hymenobacter sp. BRD128 TaxID=2675878 RepID=UPI001564D817|nr:DoxX family protein [Hymenobacter sp. BRD128]QKG56947.1 DoxX family protein [Hymenobacter sp. BRD128]
MTASTRNAIAWILQGLAGLAFIASGVMKFMDLPKTVSGFTGMGFPAWFAYLIATAEVLGGIGLLVPRFTRLAAAGLIIIMLGAIWVHATKVPGGIATGVPAISLLVILFIIIALRRPAPLAA